MLQRNTALSIVTYPHPTLRRRAKPIRRVDTQLRDIIQEMFRLMYEARGVGLAATQVNLPLRLFIVNLRADPTEGEELVFINPVLSRPKQSDEAEEGCLSLPGLYGEVTRPKQIRINAYNLSGEEFEADVTGLFARVVQHEFDHLDGILFPDRMSETGQLALRGVLEEFETEFQGRRELGEIGSDDEIARSVEEWEKRYC